MVDTPYTYTHTLSSVYCADAHGPDIPVLLASSNPHPPIPHLHTHTHTHTQVSIFVLNLDSPLIKPLPTNEREQLIDIYRRDLRAYQSQTHTLTHPNILKIHQVMEENKKCLAFVAERVLFSLSNALHRDLPTASSGGKDGGGGGGGGPPVVPRELIDYRATEVCVCVCLCVCNFVWTYFYTHNFSSFDFLLPSPLLTQTHKQVEIGRGLTHLLSALTSTHYVARRLHLGLCPENIYITPTGVWKLGGFGFSLTLSPQDIGANMQVLCPYYQSPTMRKAGGIGLEPPLSYTG
jgi:hypothetical protein